NRAPRFFRKPTSGLATRCRLATCPASRQAATKECGALDYWTWRGHSCLQRRDSSRRFLMSVGWCFRESCHSRLQESESQSIARTIRAENDAWPGAGEHSAETPACGSFGSLGAADTSVRATSSPTNSSRRATKLTCSSTSETNLQVLRTYCCTVISVLAGDCAPEMLATTL